MARHSFIQMSKLPNVKGRISYITSHARQENLYATYRTADNEFWSNLARESQQEFQRSGTEGKCIEARELIIALPEVYTRYEPQEVLEDFTEEFRKRYCMSLAGTEAYKAGIRDLQQTYAGQLRILLGVEQDFYSEAPTDDYDYVIGSVHYVKKDGCYLPVDESRELQLQAVAEN